MIATQAKRAEPTQILSLVARLAEARENTDALFRIIRPEALYDRPIAERHRIIFYIGHLEAFEWNLFRHGNPSLKSFAPDYDKLFAFGIDPVDGGLPGDQPKDWPTLDQVAAYNKQVRQTIGDLIASHKLTDPAGAQNISQETLLNVAIEHRLMHAETLAYMFHRLPFDKKISQSQSIAAGPAVRNETMNIPAGAIRLGLSREDTARFGWDNEYEAHTVHVPAFQIDRYMVTNGDFLNFVLDAGYEDSRLWSCDDWEWKQQSDIHHPAFWEERGGQWFYRGMFEAKPLPLAAPVYVSHAEAQAYARWAKKELPSEEQWQRAAYGAADSTDKEFPWGNDYSPQQGNFDFADWDPVDVTAFPSNRSAFGVTGQLGNGWEWTSTPFAPFQGFEPFPFYQGYSANFFDGKHYVIKGGSARTAACMLRASFRNWFQPHYQYVYAGFRCISI